MIQRLWQFFTQITYDYPDNLRAQRAQFVLRLAQVVTAVTLILTITITLVNALNGQNAFGVQVIIGAVILPSSLIIVTALQNGFERLAILVLVTLLLAIGVFNLADGIGSVLDIAIVTPVILVALLLSWRETFLAWLIASLFIVQSALANPIVNAQGVDATLPPLLTLLATLTVVSFTVVAYTQQTEQATARFESDAYRIRRITQAVSTLNITTDERAILERIIKVISDTLNANPVTFYFTDENGQLVQRFRTGQSDENAPINIAPSSALAQAARLREAIAVNLATEAPQRRHFEAGTVVAAAVPVYYQQDLIGVLDVQSANPDSITPNNVLTLQALANLLYGTLTQARTIRTMRDDIQTQQGIIVNQRDRLRYLDERDKQRITQSWDEYLTGRRADALGFDFQYHEDAFTAASDLPDEIRASLEAGEVIISEDNDQQKISVPIIVRRQTIGAMSFTMPPQRRANPRQIELLQSVVQRLGLALENKRLVEQSQSQAQRESRANEIGSLLLSTTDIESVLAIAAENFNQALGAIQTQIHIQPRAITDTMTTDAQDIREN